MTGILRRAMQNPDDYVIEMQYIDSTGASTRRTVSPIRFLSPGRLLAFCLCREEPRQFHLARCSHIKLKPAHEVLMPMTLETVAS